MPYDATGRSAGQEISSTYEGRHVQMYESDLTHPTHTDGFVDKGDPVLAGNLVGIAFKSAAAATDLVAIDTEGLWFLDVVASDEVGTSAVAIGDVIYIDPTTAVLSKVKNGIPFGIALGALAASGTAAVVAVKVHNHLAGQAGFPKGTQFEVSMPSFAAADVAKGFFIANRPL